jgi:hypothetical protein
MDISNARRTLVLVFGAVLIMAGAGFAAARTSGGPPWAQEPECDPTVDPTCEVVEEEVDLAQVQADVEEFFGSFESDCGTAVLGEADLTDEATLEAFDSLMTSLESGQTSHMVQGVRSVLKNCEDHPNDGLMNALYHHGLNWLRHHEHEMWLQGKFGNTWPDGKPGNGGAEHGNPHTTASEDGSGHGNGNSNGHGAGSSNGNAYGHSR